MSVRLGRATSIREVESDNGATFRDDTDEHNMFNNTASMRVGSSHGTIKGRRCTMTNPTGGAIGRLGGPAISFQESESEQQASSPRPNTRQAGNYFGGVNKEDTLSHSHRQSSAKFEEEPELDFTTTPGASHRQSMSRGGSRRRSTVTADQLKKEHSEPDVLDLNSTQPRLTASRSGSRRGTVTLNGDLGATISEAAAQGGPLVSNEYKQQLERRQSVISSALGRRGTTTHTDERTQSLLEKQDAMRKASIAIQGSLRLGGSISRGNGSFASSSRGGDDDDDQPVLTTITVTNTSSKPASGSASPTPGGGFVLGQSGFQARPTTNQGGLRPGTQQGRPGTQQGGRPSTSTAPAVTTNTAPRNPLLAGSRRGQAPASGRLNNIDGGDANSRETGVGPAATAGGAKKGVSTEGVAKPAFMLEASSDDEEDETFHLENKHDDTLCCFA
jgi:hypothetical protein